MELFFSIRCCKFHTTANLKQFINLNQKSFILLTKLKAKIIMKKTFGQFINELRIKRGLTLREFCKINGHDPGNWSKLERGLLFPPENEETLEKWSTQLGIEKGDSDWFAFMDLASLTRGKIPSDIINDEELMSKVPLFFRSIRGDKLNKEELKSLLKIIK